MTPGPDALRQRLLAEATSWLGTPYHHLGDVKGVGVDCAMLLVRVCTAAGAIPPDTDPRPYAHDWHLHAGRELFLEWLQAHGRPVDRASLLPGDVGVWRFGRTYSHGALLLNSAGQLVHAHRPAGRVVIGNLNEHDLACRPACFWRLRALETP